MKITVIFHGVLANFIGEKRFDFDLPGASLYSDLLSEIGRSFSWNMSDKLWDKERNVFKISVLATRDERHLTPLEADAVLEHGDEIKFFLMLAGG